MFKRIAGLVFGACLILLFVLNGCMPQGNGNSEKVPVGPSSMFFERTHHFCSDHMEDRFLIGYFGDALLDTTIHLFVVSHLGDTIYHDSWEADAFLTEWEGPKDEQAQVSFLEERMQAVVGATPADSPEPVSESYGPVFDYSVNGAARRITFCRDKKKVVVL